MIQTDFLPISRDDMLHRGWYYYDFLLVTGDAYVDHPSFGAAVIGRVLESEGYRVAVLSQPDYRTIADFTAMGRPRYGALVTAGNLDSMVAHYSAAKKRRSEDYYTPGKKPGKRPDRAVIVYSKLIGEAFEELPVIIGGIEASLRRFAHYDYWENKVRPSILIDSNADLLVYGMGETAIIELARQIAGKKHIKSITDIRGTAFITDEPTVCSFDSIECESFEHVSINKRAYATATLLQHEEHEYVRGRAVVQKHGNRFLIVNPMSKPLNTQELDKFFDLPYTREVHPVYEKAGGVAAIEEVRFSVIHNRGCFGSCNFCALEFHQGRTVSSRSHESVIREVNKLVKHPAFKGYIHDVGGPTANFRKPSCTKQIKAGICAKKRCLTPTPCSNLEVDHVDYLKLLRKLSGINGVKKVFVRSGIRFDYLMLDKNSEFFSELVKNHISGQLKVAPEHTVDTVLDYMGKPRIDVFIKFKERYKKLNSKYNKKQYLVMYLMSSHPGCKVHDAIAMAEYLNKTNIQPEQVQDFYPTPGTISTCMYYTGYDPCTMKPVHVTRSLKGKATQRALLQWKNPKNHSIVNRALRDAGRADLIGFSKNCLIYPVNPSKKLQKI